MNSLTQLFKAMVAMLFKDIILIALLIGPLLMGLTFKFGTPLLHHYLMEFFQFSLTPYLALIDFMLLYMTAMMIGIMLGFFMLEERDEGVILYYTITPLGGMTYLVSRLALPALCVLGFLGIHFLFFTQSTYTFSEILWLTVFLLLQYILTAMLLIGLAGNKLEGLVVSKMLGLLLLPYGIAALTDTSYRFMFILFPSFFPGQVLNAANTIPHALVMILGVGLSVIYIIALKKRFMAKLYHLNQSD